MFNNRLSIVLLSILIVGLITFNCFADDVYPEEPITMIVGFSAGGPTDVPARIIANTWEKYIGERFIVVNITGAGGQLAWNELVNSEPDGYTIGMTNVPGMQLVSLRPAADFTAADFDYIGCNIIDPAVIMVRADSEFDSIEKLLDFIIGNPGRLVAGMNGPGSDDQLALVMFEDAWGRKIQSVVMFPEGEADAAISLLGGHIDFMFGNVSTADNHPGEIKVLTVFNRERLEMYPDVPTVGEAIGVDVIEFSARGFGAPKGIPENRLNLLRETFIEAVNDPETITALERAGFPYLVWDYKEYGDNVLMLDEVVNKFREDLGL